MAEIAAGALVAEQAVATGLEAAAAASMARPTQPLRASLTQIVTLPAGDSSCVTPLPSRRHVVYRLTS